MKKDARSEWIKNISAEDWALRGMAIGFEDKCFRDLLLEDSSIRRRLLRYKVLGDDGEWHEAFDDARGDTGISIDDWIFTYRRMRKWVGLCVYRRRTIFIHSKLRGTDLDATVLHEMIHAYEHELTQPYREWLVLEMHRRMSKQIKPATLQRYIDASTHSVVHNCTHGVLFLLKSLDLDLRFGWEPGTVFGYGRTDYFKRPKKRSEQVS